MARLLLPDQPDAGSKLLVFEANAETLPCVQRQIHSPQARHRTGQPGFEVVDVTQKWFPPDPNDLIQRYLAGESANSLARAHGVSKVPVLRFLRETEVKMRTPSEAESAKWARMSPSERNLQVLAAHEASRGRKHSLDVRSKMALSREKSGKQSDLERKVQEAMETRGMAGILPQKAIGPYNVDLAAAPVALEVFGGSWHFTGRHAARTLERLDYLFKRGWHVLMLWHQTAYRPLDDAAFEYAVTFVKEARANPDAVREFRVIRGGGELMASGFADEDDINFLPETKLGRDPATGRYVSVSG